MSEIKEDYRLMEQEILRLKNIAIDSSISIDEKFKAKAKYHELSLQMLRLIDEKDSAKNASMDGVKFLEYVDSMPKLIYYQTGIRQIDTFLGGITRGLFINIAGESFSGKTTLCLNWALNMAQGHKVKWFNFEMSKRLFAKKIRDCEPTEQQLRNFDIDCDSYDKDELFKEISLATERGCFLFFIDSKMKIKSSSKGGEKEYQSISKLSDELSKLANKKDITIILINQTSEEDLKNRRLSFKGSGDQKYDTDLAFFMVIDRSDEEKSIEDKDRVLICSKNRMNDKVFQDKITPVDYKSSREPLVIEYETKLDDPMSDLL